LPAIAPHRLITTVPWGRYRDGCARQPRWVGVLVAQLRCGRQPCRTAMLDRDGNRLR